MTPTAQDVFNTAALGMLTQGAKSISLDGRQCVYRGPDGRKCGAGFLLTDEEATKADTENCEDASICVVCPPRLKQHVDLLSDIQSCHDGYCVGEWPSRLRVIASKHQLSHGVVDSWEFPSRQ